MYTRSVEGRSSALPQVEAVAKATVEERSVASETEERAPDIRKRPRYRAVRIPVLREAEISPPCEGISVCGCDEEQISEPIGCVCEHKRTRDEGMPFFGFGTDRMLIIALAVLLLCEGEDDILILALCFILL